MSRSYKKLPIMVGQNGKSLKRKANKTVRRYNKELINSLKKNDFNESIDSCKKEISKLSLKYQIIKIIKKYIKAMIFVIMYLV